MCILVCVYLYYIVIYVSFPALNYLTIAVVAVGGAVVVAVDNTVGIVFVGGTVVVVVDNTVGIVFVGGAVVVAVDNTVGIESLLVAL